VLPHAFVHDFYISCALPMSCTHICTYAYTHIQTHTCTHTHMHTHLHTPALLSTAERILCWQPTSLPLSSHTHAYTHIHVHTHAYTETKYTFCTHTPFNKHVLMRGRSGRAARKERTLLQNVSLLTCMT